MKTMTTKTICCLLRPVMLMVVVVLLLLLLFWEGAMAAINILIKKWMKNQLIHINRPPAIAVVPVRRQQPPQPPQ
jgi:hypothetical protein